MKRKYIILSIVVICLLGVFLFFYKNVFIDKLIPVSVGDNIFLVEIADSAEKKVKGLSDKEFLPENQGMLFVYNHPQMVNYWMKGMLIPLDFIWIYKGRVVGVDKNITPDEYQPPKTISPNQEITEVLEVNSGAVDRLEINIGDVVNY